MLKFLWQVLTLQHPERLPDDMLADFKREHPEIKTRDAAADYLVDNCGFSYGEAYSAIPKCAFPA